MKEPTDIVLCTHLETQMGEEIPAAIARIADETVKLWPSVDPKAIITTVARSINETPWRVTAKAAERKSASMHRKVRL